MKKFICCAMLFMICGGVYAEEIVATLDVTGVKGSSTNPQFAGSPFVVRNPNKNEWLGRCGW